VQIWVPLSAAIMSAASTLTEAAQLGERVRRGNALLGVLRHIATRWASMGRIERASALSRERLVIDTEAAITDDVEAWMRTMTEAEKRRAGAAGGEDATNGTVVASGDNNVPGGAAGADAAKNIRHDPKRALRMLLDPVDRFRAKCDLERDMELDMLRKRFYAKSE
jgi:hypothetical protein